jgi:hypothetical protein
VRIDSTGFFHSLAIEMNAHPERYQILGDADMSATLVMRRPPGDFRVRIDFEELRCAESPRSTPASRATSAIEGDLGDWQVMFDDIVANGHATGLQTINSLALLGDRIVCAGDDPIGLDKFSRFNQTLQEFFDGTARIAVPA